jgi:hypothetical protein
MQFFIVLGVLVTASAAYLVRQFWLRALIDTSAPLPDEDDAEAERELNAA